MSATIQRYQCWTKRRRSNRCARTRRPVVRASREGAAPFSRVPPCHITPVSAAPATPTAGNIATPTEPIGRSVRCAPPYNQDHQPLTPDNKQNTFTLMSKKRRAPQNSGTKKLLLATPFGQLQALLRFVSHWIGRKRSDVISLTRAMRLQSRQAPPRAARVRVPPCRISFRFRSRSACILPREHRQYIAYTHFSLRLHSCACALSIYLTHAHLCNLRITSISLPRRHPCAFTRVTETYHNEFISMTSIRVSSRWAIHLS